MFFMLLPIMSTCHMAEQGTQPRPDQRRNLQRQNHNAKNARLGARVLGLHV